MIGPVPKELQEKIMTESDDQIMGNWLKASARANSINELIEKMEQK